MNFPVQGVSGDPVLALLEQWREWTDQEQHAIEGSDWVGLDQAQQNKQRLQQQISRLTDGPGSSSCAGAPPADRLPAEIVRRVRLLQNQERENRRLLDAKIANLRHSLAQLDASSRSLRQVQRAYGTGSSGIWHSYS